MSRILLLCFRAHGDYWPLCLRQLCLPIGAPGESFPYRETYVARSASLLTYDFGLICMKLEKVDEYGFREPRFIPIRWVVDVRKRELETSEYRYFDFVLGSTIRYAAGGNTDLEPGFAYSTNLLKSFTDSLTPPEDPDHILCSTIELDDASPLNALRTSTDEITRWMSVARIISACRATSQKSDSFSKAKSLCFTKLVRFAPDEPTSPSFRIGGDRNSGLRFAAEVDTSHKMELVSFFSRDRSDTRNTVAYEFSGLPGEANISFPQLSIGPNFQRHTVFLRPLVSTESTVCGFSAGLAQDLHVTDLTLPCMYIAPDVHIDKSELSDVRARGASKDGITSLGRPGHYIRCTSAENGLTYVARIEKLGADSGVGGVNQYSLHIIGAMKKPDIAWTVSGDSLIGKSTSAVAPRLTKIAAAEFPSEELQLLLDSGSGEPNRCRLLPPDVNEIKFPLKLAALRNTHTGVFGQTGSGKSYSVGVIVEEMLRAGKKVVVLDPNSDFIHFAAPHPDEDKASCRYEDWIKTVPDRGISVLTNRVSGKSTPLQATASWRACKLKFSDFSDRQLAALINVSRDQVETYAEHRDAIKKLRDQHSVFSPQQLINFLKATAETGGQSIRNRLAQLYQNYNVAESGIWYKDDEISTGKIRSVVEDLEEFYLSASSRLLAIDLGSGSVDGKDAKSLIAGEVLQSLIGLAVKQDSPREVFILIDEAHNVVASEPATELERVSGEYVNWIAGEGRKYGLNLMLVTQRPSKIHMHSLGMIGNLVCMKVTNREDVKVVQQVFGDVRPFLLDQVPYLPKGSALVKGQFVGFPCLLQFDRRLTSEGLREP